MLFTLEADARIASIAVALRIDTSKAVTVRSYDVIVTDNKRYVCKPTCEFWDVEGRSPVDDIGQWRSWRREGYVRNGVRVDRP